MRRLLVATALVLVAQPACDEPKTVETGSATETVSPKDAPVQYTVLRDAMDNGVADFHVLVAETTKHDDVEALLKWLYRHLVTRREDPPAGVTAYVYTTEAAYKTPPRSPIAQVVKRPSDLEPKFENKVPLEFWQEIEQALGERRDKGWKLAMKVERDDAQKTVALTVPYTEPGKDQWADSLSFNQAMQTFTDLAQALFNNVVELRGMTFTGLWKDKEVVKVGITRADYTALKLSEIDERIGSHHGRIFLQMQTGKEANLAAEKANVAAAKQNAALIGKEYRAMLKSLKGKATVSPALK